MNRRVHLIGGDWVAGSGAELHSIDPATGAVAWAGRSATTGEVDAAVAAARGAADAWAAIPVAHRIDVLDAFARELRNRREALAETISVETGKLLWDSLTEVDAMIAKVPITRAAFAERRSPQTREIENGRASIDYRPLGVLAVLGPFNFPGHLPNGHILPALLAGNTVVFKPSELAPLTAVRTVECWQAAGLPPGVLNLVQGGRETGSALAAHPDHDGVLFTGSYGAGVALSRALAGRPEAILALEMGGNNPLVVHEAGNTDAAALLAIHSAFLSAGQRCTAARRLILVEGRDADRLLERLTAALTRGIRVGAWNDRPEPFLGPLVTASAAGRVLEAEALLLERGARAIVRAERSPRGSAFVTPAIVDVTETSEREDDEIFGPLLQVVRVASFEAAIAEAKRTRYGLVAALVSDRRNLFEEFRRRVRAGLVHWNRPTTGADGRLPFGGVGRSGNHRPSGYFAIDYCTDAVASIERDALAMPAALPGTDLERIDFPGTDAK